MIKYFLLRRFFKYSAPFFRHKERSMISKYAGNPEFPIVFLVGAPRSGSTIFYQKITNELDCIYPDNLVEMNRENLFLGFKRSADYFKYTAHNTDKSKFGDTTKHSLNAPSENGFFWYKWLPVGRDYVEAEEISAESIVEIRKLFSAIINYHQKPLIIKNLKMGMRLDVLKKAFPEARIIQINREPYFNAQSIYLVRKKLSNPNQWWSVMPPNYLELLNKKNIMQQSVAQVYYLRKQISKDLEKNYPGDYLNIDYMKLNEWKHILNKVSSFIGYNGKRPGYQNTSFVNADVIKLDAEEFNELKKTVNSYDWKAAIHE